MTISDFSTVSPPLFSATGLRRRSLRYFHKLVRRPAYSPACVNRSGLLEVARAIWNARTTLSQGLSTASSCLLNKKFVSQTIGVRKYFNNFFLLLSSRPDTTRGEQVRREQVRGSDYWREIGSQTTCYRLRLRFTTEVGTLEGVMPHRRRSKRKR